MNDTDLVNALLQRPLRFETAGDHVASFTTCLTDSAETKRRLLEDALKVSAARSYSVVFRAAPA